MKGYDSSEFHLFILSLVSYFSKPEFSFTSTPAFRFLDWLSFDVHLEDVKYEKSSGLPDKAFLSSADEVSLWSRAPGPPRPPASRPPGSLLPRKLRGSPAHTAAGAAS